MGRKSKDLTRISLHVERKQFEALLALSKKSDLPVAELVRRSIFLFFAALEKRRSRDAQEEESHQLQE